MQGIESYTRLLYQMPPGFTSRKISWLFFRQNPQDHVSVFVVPGDIGHTICILHPLHIRLLTRHIPDLPFDFLRQLMRRRVVGDQAQDYIFSKKYVRYPLKT